MANYNPITLTPKGADHDEEENDDDDKTTARRECVTSGAALR